MERTYKVTAAAWKIPEDRRKENSRAGSEKRLKKEDNKAKVERDTAWRVRSNLCAHFPLSKKLAWNVETR